MECNNYLKGCNDDDVILFNGKLYKIETIKSSLDAFLGTTEYNSAADNLTDNFISFGVDIKTDSTLMLFNEGLESEILRIASNGWRKGKLKIKVSLEFIPDESEVPEYESPLDDIRREIEKNN